MVGSMKVTATLEELVVDSSDLGDEPDTKPLVGTLTFTPLLPRGAHVVTEEAGVSSIAVIREEQVSLGPAGAIEHEGVAWVKLPAPTEDDSNIRVLYWRCSFDISSGGSPIELDSVVFPAVPDTEMSISDFVRASYDGEFLPSPVIQVRGPRGYGIVSVEAVAGGILTF